MEENIYSLFPTPIYRNQIGRNFTEKEINHINGLDQRQSHGNFVSEEQYVLDDPNLLDIKTFLQEKTESFFESVYKPKNQIELRITQSWVNYSYPGQNHHIHRHPNSFLSGVLYVNSWEEIDKIWFFNERFSQITVEPIEHNCFNSGSWWFPVTTGDIIIFPSHQYHYVESVKSCQYRDARISLAFNTFLVGKIGNYHTSTELIL
jgi:uncharacterized protein (TIGR02466 family)